jgi:serine/threonine protein kinase
MESTSESSSALLNQTTVDDSFEALLREAAYVQPVFVPFEHERTLLSGRFEVRRYLGEGGMGVVYEALDREDNAVLALKSLSRLNARSIYRLKKEFRALSHLVHPNLIGIHDLYSDQGRWFFTMDLVDGVDFVKYVRGAAPPAGAVGAFASRGLSIVQKYRSIRAREARFQEEKLRDALQQLVTGVAAIHDSGKLHRDLKPSNVMVTAQGRVVILDFGLAVEHLAQSFEETSGGQMAGTPAYIAPISRPSTPGAAGPSRPATGTPWA